MQFKLLTNGQLAPMAQGQHRRQGGVAAEGHFTTGGKPAQAPSPIGVSPEKGGFRLLEASGQGLHPERRCGLPQQHHTRPIAPQGSLRKGLHEGGLERVPRHGVALAGLAAPTRSGKVSSRN